MLQPGPEQQLFRCRQPIVPVCCEKPSQQESPAPPAVARISVHGVHVHPPACTAHFWGQAGAIKPTKNSRYGSASLSQGRVPQPAHNRLLEAQGFVNILEQVKVQLEHSGVKAVHQSLASLQVEGCFSGKALFFQSSTNLVEQKPTALSMPQSALTVDP